MKPKIIKAKYLKFSDTLPELILEGRKYTTWRINDEKNISIGDKLSLCRQNGKKFVEAEVIFVKETTFGSLTKEDRGGSRKTCFGGRYL